METREKVNEREVGSSHLADKVNKGRLLNKKVAIVITDGFEESEFMEPLKALKIANAHVDIISLKKGTVKSWKDGNWGMDFPVDKTIDEANAQDYDALLLPGGVINADKLRTNQDVVNFAGGFFDDGKPIAAICHALWILLETGELKGKRITSYHSLRTDLKNGAANWVDEAVVVDDGLVTSREPKDLPAFCNKMLEEISEGKHL